MPAFALADDFLFSRRRRHTISKRDWSSDVCSSDLTARAEEGRPRREAVHPARLAVEDVGAPADGALAALEKEVDGEVVLVDGDVRRGAHRLRSEERRAGKGGGERLWCGGE